MLFKFIFHKNLFIVLSFIILIGCQLQEPTKSHGIVFLKNRADKLTIDVSNQNDVLKIIGQPHSKSITDDNEWVYIERILTKGAYHKLGQNVLKSNNVLILKFDKYGILKNKKLLNKNDKKKVKFVKKETKNELTKKSFIEKVLSSVKEKMYSNR